jgi:hypothetical protein
VQEGENISCQHDVRCTVKYTLLLVKSALLLLICTATTPVLIAGDRHCATLVDTKLALAILVPNWHTKLADAIQ